MEKGLRQDRNRCSDIKNIAIPYSNFSESIKDSWFVFFPNHVPTKNAKLLTPFGGLVRDREIGQDRDRCSKITIPYSNSSQSIWLVSSSSIMPTKMQNRYHTILWGH